MKHLEVEAIKDVSTHRYSFRNHSYAFRCPVCGRERRYNTNFLGRRRVMCSGDEKFTLRRKVSKFTLLRKVS